MPTAAAEARFVICVPGCVICGKPTKQFVSSGRYAKFCSECRASERQTFRKVCELCHAAFHTHSRKARFCSAACAAQYNGAKRRFRQTEFTCVGCGKVFVRTRGSRDAKKYCSRECAFKHKATSQFSAQTVHMQAKARWERRLIDSLSSKHDVREVHVCEHCGMSYVAEYHSSKYCIACKRIVRRNLSSRVRRCGQCGMMFCKPLGSKRRLCRTCANENQIELERRMKRRRRSVENARRRGRMKSNGPFHNVDPDSVFGREGWQCYLCGCDVYKWNGRLLMNTATLDHVIPLAKGGSHTLDNLRCACAECNSLKQDKILDGGVCYPHSGVVAGTA